MCVGASPRPPAQLRGHGRGQSDGAGDGHPQHPRHGLRRQPPGLGRAPRPAREDRAARRRPRHRGAGHQRAAVRRHAHLRRGQHDQARQVPDTHPEN